MSRDGARHALALDRIDLHEHDVGAIGFREEREQRGIAHVAAVPIGSPSISTAWNTVGRQAEAISMSIVSSGRRKMRTLPVRHVGGGDEQLQIVGWRAAPRNRSARSTTSRSGLMSSGLSLGRRETGSRRLCNIVAARRRRIPEGRSAVEQHRAAASGSSPSRLTAAPELRRAARGAPSAPPSRKPSARSTAFIAPALVPLMPSMSKPPVLEQRVEHAPGEGAMRAAALQREVDGFFAAVTRRSSRRPWKCWRR